MLCEICSENQASYVISTIIDSRLIELYACESCAINGKNSFIQQELGQDRQKLICPYCLYELSPDENRYELSLLGCPFCYEQFHKELTLMLLRIHGSTKHRGKYSVKSNDNILKYSSGTQPISRNAVSIREAQWMIGKGPNFDVVVSSRVRLARNIDGYPFCNLATQSELHKIAEIIEKALADIAKQDNSLLKNAYVVDIDDLDDVDRAFLFERHLISKDLMKKRLSRRAVIDENEIISIMINEEDHIRLQVIDSGLQIDKLWDMINEIDDKLGSKVDYAFSNEWGFLTACPSNVGTGLRVSIMFHLPALSMTKEGKKILSSIVNMGYATRGIYGEGTKNTGAFYQISNDATLGQSEEEIIEQMQSVAIQIINYEREERQNLIEKDRIKVEDAIFRSYGILTNAKTISSDESLELLSWIILGVNIGLIPDLSHINIGSLLVLTRSAHLQKMEGAELDNLTQDINRAKIIKAFLLKKFSN
ncbi:MAG: protein arginine kinase [Candidatus Poribacteria bacterium]